MQVENNLAGIVVILAPVGLIYSWYFYFSKLRREPSRWRNKISLIALVLASLILLLWPAAMIFAPKVHSATYVGAPEYQKFVDTWMKVAVRALILPFVLCFLGRPRLIAPIAVACVGTALFWLFSSMP